jgi:hypothetical protein
MCIFPETRVDLEEAVVAVGMAVEVVVVAVELYVVAVVVNLAAAVVVSVVKGNGSGSRQG